MKLDERNDDRRRADRNFQSLEIVRCLFSNLWKHLEIQGSFFACAVARCAGQIAGGRTVTGLPERNYRPAFGQGEAIA